MIVCRIACVLGVVGGFVVPQKSVRHSSTVAPVVRKEDYAPAVVSTAVAGAFGVGLWLWDTQTAALEFFAGYLVEQSLSIDNLLVFLVLFEYFKVPAGPMQNKALSYGLVGAVACRAVFVVLGAAAIQSFRPVLLVFAGILVFASFKLLTVEENDDDEDVSKNFVVRYVNQQTFVPSTDRFDPIDPTKFFTDGKATPLLAAVVCLELSDIVFAVDSVPAVFGVTRDPLIVYSSNVFAIVGLRSWYRILAQAAQDLEYLDKAVAIVLGLVGVKIAASFFGVEVPTSTSLAAIAAILGGGVALSLYNK
ncbi:hypothetical protein CTAYLR_008260 [Chrysophaeum taylorii]|uniref:Uncharacterized protein n=1 Tax=Chrysophaeum taylorii TaxID=2483200 RepID=A0AAD7U8F6_9STRA|nr:hypothetical protein CTAYLR_008260 [Chrysophaeum taylorii]